MPWAADVQNASARWYYGAMSETTSQQNTVLDEVLRDAQALVKNAAHARKKTIAVSPEVAALLASAVPDPFETFRAEVSQCQQCSLHETRTQTVFGTGNPRASLVFVGEAPGEQEDLQGEPFVGRAGKLLTSIIEKGFQIPRGDVFICNVLKCRPPGNRDPNPGEREACEPYLVRQLESIKPRVICALGGHAAKMLLRTDEAVGRLRGKWHFYQGIPVRVTYHPSYVLRSEHDKARHTADKKKVWEDVKAIIRVLDGDETPLPDGSASHAQDPPG